MNKIMKAKNKVFKHKKLFNKLVKKLLREHNKLIKHLNLMKNINKLFILKIVL